MFYLAQTRIYSDIAQSWSRLKKFLVKFLGIIDPIPDLSLYAGSFKMLHGLRGYENGDYDYDERRYAVAADKLHTKCIEERLAFLPPKERTFNRMTDDL